MDFNAVVTGDTRILARFDEWPKEFHDALYTRIRALTSELESRVKGLAPVREGNLKNEITSRVYDDPKSIKGVVYVGGSDLTKNDYIKALALEYGAHRGVKVKSYRRTISEAFGRDISPKRINVKAYSRVADIEARFYMRGGLASMEAEITASLQEVIDQAAGTFDHDA